jgi:hypothetical protein
MLAPTRGEDGALAPPAACCAPKARLDPKEVNPAVRLSRQAVKAGVLCQVMCNIRAPVDARQWSDRHSVF